MAFKVVIIAFIICSSFIATEEIAAKKMSFLDDEYIHRINSMQNSWKAGRNFDADSKDGIMRLLGALDPKNLDQADKPPLKTEDSLWPSDKEIPEKFDAREKWGKMCPQISEIQDQGNCGSCWAVSASSAATDRLCISSKGKFQGRLSAQHVAFCCHNCGFGCNGGFTALAWTFFKKGIVTGGAYNSSEGCQPYSLQHCFHYGDKGTDPYPRCKSLPDEHPACRTKCSNEKYTMPFRKDKKRFKNSYSLFDVKSMQKDIMTHGPVTVGFEVYADFLSYKSGVYEKTTNEYLGNHAVRVLGWGKENGKPYWLIANSWNPYWGDKGLFKFIQGSNHCHIEGDPNGGVPRKYKP